MNTDADFVQDLILLTEQAVRCHGKITGDANAEETFIRDQVAIGLYKKRRMTVSMEVTRDGFRKCALEAEYDRLPLERFRRFKLDLIVWPVDWQLKAPPYAIIEFKKGQNFLQDVERTSTLLSVCHQDTLGYEVICRIYKEERWFEEIEKGLKKWMQESQNTCGQLQKGEPFQIDVDKKDWCAVFVVPVRRPNNIADNAKPA